MIRRIAVSLLRTLLFLVFVIYLIEAIRVIVWKQMPPDNVFLPALQLSDMASIKRALLHSSNFVPFKTIFSYLFVNENRNIAFSNLMGNILLFIPFGMLLPLLTMKLRNTRLVFLLSIGWSLSLEIFELLFSSGTLDVDDLILNSLGAMIGYLIIRLMLYFAQQLFRKSNRAIV